MKLRPGRPPEIPTGFAFEPVGEPSGRVGRSSPPAAYLCDSDGLITYFNDHRRADMGAVHRNLTIPQIAFADRSNSIRRDGKPIAHDECWMALCAEDGPRNTMVKKLSSNVPMALGAPSWRMPIQSTTKRATCRAPSMSWLTSAIANGAEEVNAFLSAIVESAEDAIISKTLDGVVRSWNTGAERLFGYSASEAIGQSVTIIIPPERLDEEQVILSRLRRGERIEHYETVRLSKDGRRIDISLTISPIRDSTGRIIGASKIARDITARKQSEAALVALKNQLQEADRRKDEFLAMLAHELRNPLAVIGNSLQLLRLDDQPRSVRAEASRDHGATEQPFVPAGGGFVGCSRASRAGASNCEGRRSISPRSSPTRFKQPGR